MVVNEKRNNGAFTLAELLVAFGIVLLLAALVGGAMVGARRLAQTSACLSNLRQWGGALQAYQQDYDGIYPAAATATFVGRHARGGDKWYGMLRPYTKHEALFCPAREMDAKREGHDEVCGYALNTGLNRLKKSGGSEAYQGKSEAVLEAPASIVAVFDARAGIIASDAPDIHARNLFGSGAIWIHSMRAEIRRMPQGATRHNGGANYGFADGHTKWLRPDALVRVCDGTKPCFTP